MLEIEIPGFGQLNLNHIVLDYNGTLAKDGKIGSGVRDRLKEIAKSLSVHILTADTFGKAASELKQVPCYLHILKGAQEDLQKEEYIRELGPEQVVAFGNGNNDVKMLQLACLGIAVIEGEGCSARAVQTAHIVVNNIIAGLDLLLNPLRVKATLRF
jgi:soluble P-type ATPase